MVKKITQTNLETYGEYKNPQTIIRVLLFFGLLVAFVFILSIARQPIMNKYPVSSSITGFLTGENAPSTVVRQGYSNNLLDALPEGTLIALNVGEKEYIVTKSKIVLGSAEDADITISVPEKYSQYLNGDICELARKANGNGELGIEMHKSKTALAFKYRSLFQYRDCLG